MAVTMAGRWAHNPVHFSHSHHGAGVHFAPHDPRTPPSNPRSNYYLVVCFVCQEVAKPNQEHSLHYGGIVCYSCRAFFRRAHQVHEYTNSGLSNICRSKN